MTASHALPGDRLEDVLADVLASAPNGAMVARVTGVRSLGRGVAYDLSAPAAESIRAGLADGWYPWLTAQDRQRWRPHVTVQNKVAPEVARAVHADLAAAFVPYDATAVGWQLFPYRGGPWERVWSLLFEP